MADAENCNALAPSGGCITPSFSLASNGKRLSKDGGGGAELVTELPGTGQVGFLYILVDDAENPTKAHGIYVYDNGWILTAEPIDQSVEVVSTLPSTGRAGVLYYLETGQDEFDLYRWVNDDWVKVDTDVILYSGTGQNVNGAMTQKATTDALDTKIPMNATFWGASYNSANNRASGLLTMGAAYSNGEIWRSWASNGTNPFGGYSAYHQTNPFGGLTIRLDDGTASSPTHSDIFQFGGWVQGLTVPNRSYISLSMSDHKITDVTDPTNSQDAATKNYVDTAVASAGVTTLTDTEFNQIIEEA